MGAAHSNAPQEVIGKIKRKRIKRIFPCSGLYFPVWQVRIVKLAETAFDLDSIMCNQVLFLNYCPGFHIKIRYT